MLDDHPPRLKPNRQRLLPLVLAAGAVTGAIVIYLFNPAEYGFYPICYLHFTTGLNCPGCGAMRAFHEILHGNIRQAAKMNVLVVMLLPISMWSLGRRSLAQWSGRKMSFSIQPFWLFLLLAVTGIFTVIRNLPGFEWLSP